MKKKKLKKLVLRKETVTLLDDLSQSRLKGGGDGTTAWIHEYATYLASHMNPNDCIASLTDTCFSHCYCTHANQAQCNYIYDGGELPEVVIYGSEYCP